MGTYLLPDKMVGDGLTIPEIMADLNKQIDICYFFHYIAVDNLYGFHLFTKNNQYKLFYRVRKTHIRVDIERVTGIEEGRYVSDSKFVLSDTDYNALLSIIENKFGMTIAELSYGMIHYL